MTTLKRFVKTGLRCVQTETHGGAAMSWTAVDRGANPRAQDGYGFLFSGSVKAAGD